MEYASLTDEEAECLFASELHRTCEELEETIAFYKAMGAVVTKDTIKEIEEDEPCDLQMRCVV